ncbi:MAG: site-specific integrase [Arcicella sp.]|nr:site-specific integrase [Arcicella sp.]
MKSSKSLPFLEVYEMFYNSKIKRASVAESTKKQASIMKNRVYKFLEENNKLDIQIESVCSDLLNDFFSELKQSSKPSSTYYKNLYYELDKVFEYAIKKNLCKENPLFEIDLYRCEKKELLYLTPEQINFLTFVKVNPYLRTVIDVFLVQCFTGFSYIDLMKFDPKKHIFKDLKTGKSKIILDRQKTGVTCTIPVLPRVEKILKKYNYILPTKNYPYYLTMLDVIGSILNLPFKLTTHIGRKTAGVYLLNEGVSIEVVSQVLGHASVITTQKTYTTILDKRIDKEFEHLY